MVLYLLLVKRCEKSVSQLNRKVEIMGEGFSVNHLTSPPSRLLVQVVEPAVCDHVNNTYSKIRY